MRYTINGGIERPLSDRFNENLRYLLPLIAILFVAIFLGLHQTTGNRKAQKPVTLGIYTVKTPANGGTSSGSGNNGSGSSSDPNSGTQSTLMIAGPAASPSSSSSSLPFTGGRGGGDTGSTTTTPTSPTPTVISTGTVACTNLLTVDQLCTTCLPPLTLHAGQKAILYTDGSCAAVN